MHARQAIRHAVKAALTGLAATADRVYLGRTAPIADNPEPLLLVRAAIEQSAPITMRGTARTLQRELQMIVEVCVNDPDDETGDDRIDAIALDVEQALAANPTLGGLCRDLWLTTSGPSATAQGEQRAGRLLMQFTVLYMTAANAPAVGL